LDIKILESGLRTIAPSIVKFAVGVWYLRFANEMAMGGNSCISRKTYSQ